MTDATAGASPPLVDAVTRPVAKPARPTREVGRVRRAWRRIRDRRQRARDTAASRVATGSDPSSEALLDVVDWTRWYPALIWFAAGVVAVTFALSYHGLFEAAREIVHYPMGLAVVVPVGVDVFSLACLTATFLARDAHWRVRFYCWLMFAFTVAVSVAGNAVYAVSDVQRRAGDVQIRWGYLQIAAVAGAALWPAFSAGALHLLIVIRRHLQRQRDKARQALVVAAQAQELAAEEEAAEELLQARAINLAAGGATAADIRKNLGLPEERQRSVERWTETVRAALAAPKPVVVAAKATSKRTTTVRTNTTTE